ncbi:Prefoldin [Lipomyces oligophaga]|uniref:Prefoldin n=1 Tax=Lipomyces oligophaga TaxID=45792 RepID=UPI0034CE85A0
MANAKDQAEYEKILDSLRSIQLELSTFIETRQKLESQLQESLIVQKEFDILDQDSKIYKLIGPVLVPQDRQEAVMNVDKRLEFIQSEIKRTETKIAEAQTNTDKKRSELLAFQAQIQQKVAGAAA